MDIGNAALRGPRPRRKAIRRGRRRTASRRPGRGVTRIVGSRLRGRSGRAAPKRGDPGGVAGR